jgi:NADH-quinone oxidoreductase subunit K
MNNQIPEIFTTIPLTHYLLLGTILFVVGLIGVMVRKNVIIVFMCIEIMLNAVNLMLTSTSAYFSNSSGQIMVFFYDGSCGCRSICWISHYRDDL